MFLLDTNVVSALRRPSLCPPALVRLIDDHPPEAFQLSVISILEIEIGVLRKERSDPRQGELLRLWSARVYEEFAGRILAMTDLVALAVARMHVPDPKPERDAIIAATALVHGLTVVTRNTADFRGLSVPVLDPWQPA